MLRNIAIVQLGNSEAATQLQHQLLASTWVLAVATAQGRQKKEYNVV
jgi:hypothetical protein